MELYQLKTFVTVAEEGHLTRAAERLHTSQPAVSAHIKALEEELGMALFIRTPKGMQLTPDGDILRRKAEAALASVSEIRQQADILKSQVSGTVRLGLHIDPRYLRIDGLLSWMSRRYREVDFHLLQRWSWEQPEAIRTGALDAGFVYRQPTAPGLTAVDLGGFDIRVVGPAGWADRLRNASWEDIAAMPWVWTPPHCVFCELATAAFEARGLKPFKVTVADQEPVVRMLVENGVGLAFMIAPEATDARQEGRLAVWDEVVTTMDLWFIHASRREADPVIKALVEGIRATWPRPDRSTVAPLP